MFFTKQGRRDSLYGLGWAATEGPKHLLFGKFFFDARTKSRQMREQYKLGKKANTRWPAEYENSMNELHALYKKISPDAAQFMVERKDIAITTHFEKHWKEPEKFTEAEQKAGRIPITKEEVEAFITIVGLKEQLIRTADEYHASSMHGSPDEKIKARFSAELEALKTVISRNPDAIKKCTAEFMRVAKIYEWATGVKK